MAKKAPTSRGNLILSVGLLLATSIFSIIVSFVLYNFTKNALENRLKDILIGIVSTASVQVDTTSLSKVHNAESVQTNAYKNLVWELQLIRQANKNVKYAYLLRQTSDKEHMQYIADADSIDPTAKIDLNGDGIIDEADALVSPGDDYDVSEIPALQNDAPNFPTTDPEPAADQWGNFLSAYAPIKVKGETVAILGIDVEVTEYLKEISQTFYPFAIFVIFLLVTLGLLTYNLTKVWGDYAKSLKELDRQKDELLGLVSHQLAAPVSAIRWYVEMLLDGDLGVIPKEQKEQLETVYHTATGLTDLVSMILDVSRVELGRVKVDKQQMDLDELFKEILAVVEPKALERKIEFIKEMPERLPHAMLDKRYTHMTLENLLTNAIKYTPEHGKVTVRVSINDDQMNFLVTDTGCGIPAADQKKIFGKMFRASNVRNSSTDGNGFGLFVAKGAVESQGGKIWFESTEGKGTTFYITLPLNTSSIPSKVS